MLNKQTLQLFSDYCNLNTSYADGRHYSQVLDLLEPLLQESGFATQRVKIPKSIAEAENRVNLIAKLDHDETLPTLLIYNHIDVVPADYDQAFSFKVENNRAYARGAADHKGSTIAVLEALKDLNLADLRFNLVFILTTDEETFQLPQLKFLEDFLQVNPKKTLCFDPDTFAGGVTTSHLGIYTFSIKAQGKSVHSGMSHLGVNAVEALLSLYPDLLELKEKYAGLQSQALSFPKDGKSLQVKSGFNLNMIKGGLAANIVPDQTELVIDVRFAPEVNVSREVKFIGHKLKQAFSKQKAQFELEERALYEGYTCQHHEIDNFEKILQDVSQEKGQYCVLGSTPVAHWTKQLKIPHFGLGVARYDSNVHGVNENCHLADLKTVTEVFRRYIKK